MLTKVRGVVLRTVDTGENDRLLDIFTQEKGLLCVCVKGARSLKSKNMPASELFCYAEYLLYDRGGKYWVRESDVIESFYRIRGDIERLYLGEYLCELCREYTLPDTQDEPLLRLLLNSLYLLAGREKDIRVVKAAFELRSAVTEGFAPDLDGCRLCGKVCDDMLLEAIEGSIICASCREKIGFDPVQYEKMKTLPIVPIDRSTLDALRYISSAPIEKCFSFHLPDEEMWELYDAAETYTLHQMERGFSTLDFFHTLYRRGMKHAPVE